MGGQGKRRDAPGALSKNSAVQHSWGLAHCLYPCGPLGGSGRSRTPDNDRSHQVGLSTRMLQLRNRVPLVLVLGHPFPGWCQPLSQAIT